MRLGGPIFAKYAGPQEWAAAVREAGYRAAVCPINYEADDVLIEAYRLAAMEYDIVIAEVGAWSNPISPNQEVREAAINYCKKQLGLAEKIGAKICVNIAGGRGEQWDGPHPDNLSESTFEMIVDTVREIIDEVKPKSTFYTLESMPWVFPDSPDSYLALIKAIDRPQFAVHLDPVNLVNSPRRYFDNAGLIKECFAKLGPYIKSCHAKDIKLSGKLTVHLDEVVPGTGALDYRTFLSELNKLDADIPILLEHLSSEEQYKSAAAFIKSTSSELKIAL